MKKIFSADLTGIFEQAGEDDGFDFSDSLKINVECFCDDDDMIIRAVLEEKAFDKDVYEEIKKNIPELRDTIEGLLEIAKDKMIEEQ